MERKEFIRSFAILGLFLSVFMASCTEQQVKTREAGKTQTYTCPMHPQIVQDKPSTCPICGMDLVPFEKNATDAMLTLDERQEALANVTTAQVGMQGFETFKQLNGRLIVNPEKTAYISARVPGRIERLYVRQTGEKINKGQALYKVYSEQLATLQQEYLLVNAQAAQFPADKVFAQMLKSSEQKLSLYGQSASQIQRLKKDNKADPYVTFSAPENGIVAEVAVTEGQYVSEGSPILRLEGYQSLWVEADLYPSEAAHLKSGQKVKVVVPGWEDQPQLVTVEFINPAVQTNAQTIQLRGSIPNPGNQWQAGLQANLFLPIESKGDIMSLPIDAVVRSGKGAHVWVEKTKGKFEPRRVTTGAESFDTIEIKTGLKTGERVVITGAYLLYSEYILKKGKDPMDVKI